MKVKKMKSGRLTVSLTPKEADKLASEFGKLTDLRNDLVQNGLKNAPRAPKLAAMLDALNNIKVVEVMSS
jgi:hypothetical protein